MAAWRTRTAVVLVLAATVVTAGVGAGPNPAAAATQTAYSTQSYYWRWSDGSEARHRTFRQSEYRVPERLPRLIVSAYPSGPSRQVTLQYRRDGRWLTEDTGRTDRGGQVRLTLTPYCPDGRWCDGTFDYRALAGGHTASLRVTYAP